MLRGLYFYFTGFYAIKLRVLQIFALLYIVTYYDDEVLSTKLLGVCGPSKIY